MQNIMIPEPLQICMDDVGWHNGSDDRPNGGSARTAMPRRHCAEDYAAVEKLGEKLRMRINCGFVLGEWDPDNRLRGVPHATKYGSRWDNAAFLDRDETERCAALLRSSAWIDIAVHGLHLERACFLFGLFQHNLFIALKSRHSPLNLFK